MFSDRVTPSSISCDGDFLVIKYIQYNVSVSLSSAFIYLRLWNYFLETLASPHSTLSKAWLAYQTHYISPKEIYDKIFLLRPDKICLPLKYECMFNAPAMWCTEHADDAIHAGALHVHSYFKGKHSYQVYVYIALGFVREPAQLLHKQQRHHNYQPMKLSRNFVKILCNNCIIASAV